MRRKNQPEPPRPRSGAPVVHRRTFAGPHETNVPLRVSFERDAYSAILVHTQESLDAEVCGILAGEFCEDDGGPFVRVLATVRGEAAKEAAAHVTFTQETWKHIHDTMEHDYPKLQIVGWYHSHPGFGVVLSEMDTFIHRNFFPSASQVALVTDPLGTEEALCMNSDDGVRYLERFWVASRERRCFVPWAGSGEAGGKPVAGDAGTRAALERIESRLSQAVQSLDEAHVRHQRLQTLVATLLLAAVLGSVAWGIVDHNRRTLEPPRVQSYVPVPIVVNGEIVELGVAVVDWHVPPKVTAAYVELERQARERRDKAAADAAKAGGNGAPGVPAAPKP